MVGRIKKRPSCKWSQGEAAKWVQNEPLEKAIKNVLAKRFTCDESFEVFSFEGNDRIFSVFTRNEALFLKKLDAGNKEQEQLTINIVHYLMSNSVGLQDREIVYAEGQSYEIRPYLEIASPPYDAQIEKNVIDTIINFSLSLQDNCYSEAVKTKTQEFDRRYDLDDSGKFLARLNANGLVGDRSEKTRLEKLISDYNDTKKQITHGDLHPSNLLVSSTGDVFLTDFETLHRSFRHKFEDLSYFCLRYLYLDWKQSKVFNSEFAKLVYQSFSKVERDNQLSDFQWCQFVDLMEVCCLRNLVLSEFYEDEALATFEKAKFQNFYSFAKSCLRDFELGTE